MNSGILMFDILAYISICLFSVSIFFTCSGNIGFLGPFRSQIVTLFIIKSGNAVIKLPHID